MKKALCIVLLCLFLNPVGCTIPDNFLGVNWTPKAKLYSALAAYKEVKLNLIALRTAGKFTTPQADQIKIIMVATEAVLDQWAAAVQLGLPTDTYPTKVDEKMLSLTTTAIAAERTP